MNDPLFEFLNEKYPPTRNFYHYDNGVKEYRRFPTIPLPPPREVLFSVSESIKKRRSALKFNGGHLSAGDISTLLFWSAGMSQEKEGGTVKRHVPSGGGKYPIELYPIILKCDGIQRGVYHYNAKTHALEFLPWANSEDVLKAFNYPLVHNAAVIMLMSFIKEKQVLKYGPFSYKLGLLEAGHIGQNIYLVSAAENYGCRALGIGDSSPFDGILGLDGVNEMVCYAIAVGQIAKGA